MSVYCGIKGTDWRGMAYANGQLDSGAQRWNVLISLLSTSRGALARSALVAAF